MERLAEQALRERSVHPEVDFSLAERLAQTAPSVNARHHPVFEDFADVKTPGDDRDFVGGTNGWLLTEMKSIARLAENRVEQDWASRRLPVVDENYFEWIDVLMSARDAGDSYTMIELGAGFGRWGVRGGLAARHRGVRDIKLAFAEAEPKHLGWLKTHLADNGFSADETDIFGCAVSDHDGTETFLVQGPEEFHDGSDVPWFGQSLFRCAFDTAQEKRAAALGEQYCGHPVKVFPNDWRGIEVPKRKALDILGHYPSIDLLDMDVQGEEGRIVESAIHHLNQACRRLHIGTHSRDLEAQLRTLLSAHGWLCIRDYACNTTVETPFGAVSFCDGVQSWLNPRFAVTWG